MECRLRRASPDTISLVECKRLHEWNRLSTFKMLETGPERVSGLDFRIGNAGNRRRGTKKTGGSPGDPPAHLLALPVELAQRAPVRGPGRGGASVGNRLAGFRTGRVLGVVGLGSGKNRIVPEEFNLVKAGRSPNGNG
jgi:hypothetical protein